MAYSLKVSAHSETGLVRRNNQDSAYASPTLIVVADGMGGAAAGDLASAVAIQRLSRADGHYEGEAMLLALSDAMDAANDELADLIAYNPDWDGMGTTVCGALFSGTQLGVVHIGDSRGYLLRGGQLTQLTHDHSWVQSLIDDGRLTPEEAASHPKRSLLVKVLNGQPGMRADLATVDLELGDRVMFCSDGLCGLVGTAAMTRLMQSETLGDAVRKLAAAARRAGGFDNITLVLAEVCEQDDALDAKPGQTLGAAAQVDVPQVPSAGGTAALLEDPEDAVDAAGPDRGDALSDDAPPDDAPPQAIPTHDAAADDAPCDQTPDQTPDETPLGDESGKGPAKRPRRRWVVPVVWIVAVLVVVAAALCGARAWLDQQYYLGDDNGTVGVYQGLPETVAGVSLGHVVAGSATNLDDLPPYYADQVRTGAIRPESLAAAQQALSQLDAKAQICIAQRAGASSGAQPSSPASSDTEACS